MKNILPKYRQLNIKNDYPSIGVDFWDRACDNFDNKNYKQSVIETINYINSSLLEKVDADKDIAITKNQGSAKVTISMNDNELAISAPFLKINDDTNKIALLRRVAEVNFGNLTLPQINLKDDFLWLNYNSPLELCEPYKTYDAIREVCVVADDYDDEFIENFGASFYQEQNHIQLTQNESDEVWDYIQEILKEHQAYIDYFVEKRWHVFQWDITYISILKIVNIVCVHGTLRTKLQEQVYNLYNGDLDFDLRINKGKAFMNKLRDMSKEDIMKNMYHAETLISLKWRSSNKVLSEEMKACQSTVEDYLKKEDHFSLCYYLQFTFLRLIYNFNLDENYKNAIENTLKNTSGLEPHKASSKLVATYQNILNHKINRSSKANIKKGFFAKLFN